MATPEVVLGASLLAMFLVIGVNTGFVTIVLAHILVCVSYVVVTVKARLAALHASGLLDSKPEPAFDDLVRLAAQICLAPVARISLGAPA